VHIQLALLPFTQISIVVVVRHNDDVVCAICLEWYEPVLRTHLNTQAVQYLLEYGTSVKELVLSVADGVVWRYNDACTARY